MAALNHTSPTNRSALAGQQIGYLRVIEDIGADERGHRIWRCLCTACDREYLTRAGYLTRAIRRGSMSSCGCHKARTMTTHGRSDTPGYEAWSRIIKRCTDAKHEHFPHYGGRGIQVCERWKRFEGFWQDMGPSWAAGLSIDRIDVDGNYEPSNCRWATAKMQANNKRSNRYLETPAGRMTLAQAAEHYNIDRNTISQRIDVMGWSVEDAVSRPKRVLKKT